MVHSHLGSVKVQFNSRTNKKTRAGVAVGIGVGSLNDKSLCFQKFAVFNTDMGFPVLHKVGIFVQLIMRINWKWLAVESTLMPLYICHDAIN